MNTAQQLLRAGQSIWYDNIQRSLLNNGELAAMISRGEVRGVTSNPTIFLNAIKSEDYHASLIPLARAGKSAEEIFWRLAIEDVRRATDLFRPMYEESGGGDGYVSLEVSPYLAYDAGATLEAAQWIWERVDRPNLMVKIPATAAGLPAIAGAIAAGINVNATLIFSIERYAGVVDAYLKGLEQRVAAGQPVGQVSSVASFFVSRVDTKVDGLLAPWVEQGGALAGRAASLLGKAAIANAKLAYARFREVLGSPRFLALGAQGARPQRPLWASTGTKNKAYSDVIYVDELVGPHTVNTVPPATLSALLDHGAVRPGSLMEDIDDAERQLADLETLGVSIRAVTAELEKEGVQSFADAFTALLKAIDASREKALA